MREDKRIFPDMGKEELRSLIFETEWECYDEVMSLLLMEDWVM